MIKIFAKRGTDEKVLMPCPKENVRDVQLALKTKYGGSWLWVDKILPTGEFLKFNDGLRYNGFHGEKERYCANIESL